MASKKRAGLPSQMDDTNRPSVFHCPSASTCVWQPTTRSHTSSTPSPTSLCAQARSAWFASNPDSAHFEPMASCESLGFVGCFGCVPSHLAVSTSSVNSSGHDSWPAECAGPASKTSHRRPDSSDSLQDIHIADAPRPVIPDIRLKAEFEQPESLLRNAARVSLQRCGGARDDRGVACCQGWRCRGRERQRREDRERDH